MDEEFSIEKFLLEDPLYKKISCSFSQASHLRNFRKPLTVYCPNCADSSVFNCTDQFIPPALTVGPSIYREGEKKNPFFFDMNFECARDEYHDLTFYFRWEDEKLSKIGEFPSRADREVLKFKRYRKELGNSFNMYKKAVYLYAQGTGIGSYAYLRRVFEDILRTVASEFYKSETGWKYEEWKKDKRVSDMIAELKVVLPEFISENPNIYGKMSQGIHELSEEECLNLFPVLLAAIEEIIDDRLRQKERKDRRAEIRKNLGKN